MIILLVGIKTYNVVKSRHAKCNLDMILKFDLDFNAWTIFLHPSKNSIKTIAV